MNLEDVKAFLRKADKNYSSRGSKKVRDFLDNLKEEAVQENDQKLAKEIWCFEQILNVQEKWIEAFKELKAGKYYEGWCSLEKVELGIHFLAPHYDIASNKYYISFINTHTSRFQSIFPYKVFISPEIREKERVCTICGEKVSIRNFCGHKPGEIYNGELCSRRVTESEILGISFVEDPVQKYSVPFAKNEETGEEEDHYNYKLVEYLISRLVSPFHGWNVNWSKRRIPHSKFTNVGRNEACPCESGKKYKKCCLQEKGVLRPHCEFSFEIEPPKYLQTNEYTF